MHRTRVAWREAGKYPTRILITGFGAFPGVERNASDDLVHAVAANAKIPGVDLAAITLPVLWNEATQSAATAIRAFQPHAVLHFGVAKRCRTFEVETRAFNRSGPRVDRDGIARGERTLVSASPMVQRSTLNPVSLLRALKAASVPATLSNNPGRYLCNAVFYTTLCGSVSSGRPLAAFVHIPAFGATEAATPRFSFDDALRGGMALVHATTNEVRGITIRRDINRHECFGTHSKRRRVNPSPSRYVRRHALTL